MCLAIPGKIESIFSKDGLQMARVNFGGVRRETCIDCIPDAAVGQFVLVHVGFALSVIDEQEAERAYRLLNSSGEIKEFESAVSGDAQR